MPLNQALDSNNAEMTKRLKYTKDILTHMLNNNQNSNPINRQASSSAVGQDPSTGLSSNSSRRAGGPITGVSGMERMNSNASGGGSNQGDPMNGFGIGGPSVIPNAGQSNGLQTMSSIAQSKRKISIGSRAGISGGQ